MKPHVVELYYSVRELAFLLRFSETTIRKWIREDQFGPKERILDVAGDIRVPASGVQAFAESHAFVYDHGVKARNKAELRRKLGQVQTSGGKEGNAS